MTVRGGADGDGVSGHDKGSSAGAGGEKVPEGGVGDGVKRYGDGAHTGEGAHGGDASGKTHRRRDGAPTAGSSGGDRRARTAEGAERRRQREGANSDAGQHSSGLTSGGRDGTVKSRPPRTPPPVPSEPSVPNPTSSQTRPPTQAPTPPTSG
jgi:hypothetical protein